MHVRFTKSFCCLSIATLIALSITLCAQDSSPKNNVTESKERLAASVKSATNSNEDNCSGFLAEVTREYLNDGETLSKSGTIRNVYRDIDLSGMQANAQIDHMAKKWKKISMSEAMKLADEGRLVVAAIKATPNGHVAVVMPGGADSETKWPRVAGGAMNPVARTATGKSMSKVWKAKHLKPKLLIMFYTPWFTPQMIPVDLKNSKTETAKVKGEERVIVDEEAPSVIIEESNYYADGSPANAGGWYSNASPITLSTARRILAENKRNVEEKIAKGESYTKYRIVNVSGDVVDE
jgi:hypothetical protein